MGSSSTITLREHCFADIPASIKKAELISYLDEVWISRQIFGAQRSVAFEDSGFSTKQPFLSFSHDNRIKAKNYVGFVHWQTTRILILPKVFEGKTEKELWPHLTYWLSYCRRVNFPFSSLATEFHHTQDFPEALLYTYALHARSVLQSTPFSSYEEVVEESQVMKGKLDFNRYINDQFVKGSPHKLVVVHTPLLFNNLLNQIIKSVSVRLQGICRFADTFHVLQDIALMLEEVDDVNVTALHCDQVHLNRLFADYRQVLDMCRFFLSEGHLSSDIGAHQNFSFMVPMELIFEDYLAGFLEHRFSNRFETSYQSTGWLTDQRLFQLRYDIVLKDKESGKRIIVDAKYKKRSYEGNGKRGIRQSDLYQMLAYAIRNDCDRVLLLYPEHAGSKDKIDRLSISSHMFKGKPVEIFAANVPFVHNDLEAADDALTKRLEEVFSFVEPSFGQPQNTVNSL